MTTTSQWNAIIGLLLVTLGGAGFEARADMAWLASPWVADAKPHDTRWGGAWQVQRAFDRNGLTEYASYEGGTSTFIVWDFGHAVNLDQFTYQDRIAHGTTGVIDDDRVVSFSLFFTDDLVNGETQYFTVDDHDNPVDYALTPVKSRYVVWQVLGSVGGGTTGNTGGMEMRFAQNFTGTALPTPTIIASSPQYQTHEVGHLLDGDPLTQFVANNVANPFVAFDFGAPVTVSALDYLARNHTSAADNWNKATLTFSDTSDFSSILASVDLTRVNLGSQTASSTTDNFNELYSFDPVTAQYVRWQVTDGSNWSGGSEMTFYAPVPEPGTLVLLGLGGVLAVWRWRGTPVSLA